MSWSTRLLRPVVPAKGKPIVTLSDARAYILALPKRQQETDYFEPALEAIMMAARAEARSLPLNQRSLISFMALSNRWAARNRIGHCDRALNSILGMIDRHDVIAAVERLDRRKSLSLLAVREN